LIEGEALVSGTTPLADCFIDVDELATELIFKARTTASTSCGSDTGTGFESLTHLLLSARAFGWVSAPAELPRGFLIRACGLVDNILLGLIGRVTAATDTLRSLLISTLFGARRWLGSGITAATHALGSLLIGACGIIHDVLISLITARDRATEAGASASRWIIIVTISARAAVVVIIAATTATTTAGWGTGDGATETGASASRWIIIVTIAA